MERIIAAGDSNTFGQHLEGLNLPINHSQYAWPSILGKLTNLPVVNLACPGHGFKAIWHILNRFEFQPNDHLILLCPPDHYRVDLITEDNIKLIRWYHKESESELFFKYIFDKHDQIIEDYILMDHINYTFLPKCKSVTQILFSLNENLWPITKEIRSKYKNLANIDFAKFDMWSLFEQYPNDRAFDKEHPGKIIQQEFAKNIYQHYFK